MAEPAQSEVEQLEYRIASLKIDLKRTFPKRADGVVDCGTDGDCFLIMAHRCEPAVLDHSVRDPGYLTIKKMHALYRITGPDGDACKVLRLVLERDMELPEEARQGLLKKGKSQAEIDTMRAEALAYLAKTAPDRSACSMPRARVLGLGLALATKESADRFFRNGCHEPAGGEAWPSDLVAPAAPLVPAAPAAPAAPAVPAPTTAQ